MDTANLRTRIGTAIPLSIFAVTAVYFGGLLFGASVGLLSWLAANEIVRLLGISRPKIFAALIHFANLSLIGIALVGRASWPINIDSVALMSFLILLLVPTLLGRFLFMPAYEGRSTLAILCTGWSFAHMVALRCLPDGFGAVTFLALCVVASDVGAYFTGNLFGKTKFAPQISPHKTTEGLIGGVICTSITAVFSAPLLSGLVSPAPYLLGLLVAILAPCGDLAVSVLKRDAGVKDAGALFPGHGGILDRFGSFILITPLFHYLYILIPRAL
jgi:phosphatidate cytidylyltransferase